jgi:hypothetical protein
MTRHRPKASLRATVTAVTGGLALLLAGCASSSPAPSSSPSAASAGASSAGGTGSAAGSSTGTGASADAGPTTLTGTVTAGVENNCVVLVDAAGTVLANLQGLDVTAHPVGSEVEVTGTFEPDLMTTCQQGPPFEVTAATAL